MARKLLPLLLLLLALPAAASVDYFLAVNSPGTVFDPGARARITAFVVPVSGRANDPTQATVTIPLPPGSTNITAPGQFGGWACSVDSSTVTCTTFLAATPPYPGIVVDFNVPASLEGVAFRGKATLATSVTDDVPANNSAGVSVTVYRILQVTTADDFGAGSLRDTIGRANAECNAIACKVTFAGPMTIEPTSALPAITACGVLVIDGGIARGTSLDVPRPVEVSGAKAGFANGIEIRTYCEVTLRGVTINGFGANGIVLAEPKAPPPQGQQPIVVEECFIGTDTTATEARPNGMRGISVETPFTNAAILNSTISGNRYSGIAVWAAQTIRISDCRIGAGRQGKPLGNGASGVYVDGGDAAIDGGGAIAYNRDFGVGVGPHASNVHVQMQNLFANAVQDLDWGLDGPTHVDPSGRMPPSPVLLAAVYDASRNITTVYGVVPRPENPPFTRFLQVLILEKTASGYKQRANAFAPTLPPGDAPFTVTVSGDMRGRTLVGQTDSYAYLDFPPFDTSELSEPLEVAPGVVNAHWRR
jgi:hypothetical protein